MKPGRFITIEGPEGVGKSTQSSLLKAHLQSLGLSVIQTREPGGTQMGEAIRDMLQHDVVQEPMHERTEALLFAASRAQHVAQKIRPALEQGTWVISDRFVDSSIAYQGVGRNLGMDAVIEINQFALQQQWPALTILLDLPVEQSLERMRQRFENHQQKPDRIERESIDFHATVRNAFLQLQDRFPNRIVRLDGDAPEHVISQQIIDLIEKRRLYD